MSIGRGSSTWYLVRYLVPYGVEKKIRRI